jgi:hypothetical protein
MNDKTDSTVYMKVYKGKNLSKNSVKYKKVIVFDLDETLGSFVDLEILWRKVQEFDPPIKFNQVLDIYPEFLRYGILYILDFLYQMKKNGQCENIYIYTNNQCSPLWVKQITQYFNYKIQCTDELFDKIVYAFKVNHRPVELWRTTHSKTYEDFIKCTLLPKSTEICFVDNTYFIKMNHKRVYYIKPYSYRHSLSTKSIIDRFCHSFLFTDVVYHRGYIESLLKEHFLQHGRIYDDTIRYLPTPEIDQLVSQKMLYHMKEFLYSSKENKTRKHKFGLTRMTRKKRKDRIH